jgi:hypothetical protein
MAATAPDLSSLFPGFDALQGLARSAGSALPGLGQWVTPTIDPDELGKRIEELKTVQFWLDQNSRMITTTIQAMEVQRMTLTTLRTMNVQAQDLAEAFKIRVPEAAAADPAPASASERPAAPAGDPAAARSKKPAQPRVSGSKAAADDPPAPGLVDPMQWWGSLAQQFTQIAAQTLKDSSAGGTTAGPANTAAVSVAGGSAQPGTSGSSRAARASQASRSTRSSKGAESRGDPRPGAPTGRRPRAR